MSDLPPLKLPKDGDGIWRADAGDQRDRGDQRRSWDGGGTRSRGGGTGVPDPFDDPGAYDALTMKRFFAFLIDMLCVGATLLPIALILWIFSVASLGLLAPLASAILGLVPITYHTLMVSGPWSSTVGQRLMGLEVKSMDGGKPSFGQALINAATFYVLGGMTGWLIVLVVFTNPQRRGLHDYLAGTVVLNRAH